MPWRILFTLIISLLPCVSYPRTFHIDFKKKSPKNTVSLMNSIIGKGPKGSRSIQLKTNNYYNRRNNILYLDFEQKKSHLLRDVSGNYKIVKSNYIVNEAHLFGKRAALFNRKENIISIKSPNSLWPGEAGIGDFTIEFWIKPVFYYRHNSIIKKYNMLEGFRQGIEVYIKNQKINFSAYNLFHNLSKQKFSLHLQSIRNLDKNKWSYILISFKVATGKMVLMVNGNEEDTVFAKDSHSIWTASINRLDRSFIQIGSSYSGYLDELRISNIYFADNKKKFNQSLYPPVYVHTNSLRVYQKTGTVRSNVIKPSKGFNLTNSNLYFYTKEPKDSNINIWVRHSKRNFDANLSENDLAWKIIRNNTSFSIGSFNFFQWKAELKANPGGTISPSLTHIKLSFDENLRLPIPESFAVIKDLSNKSGVCLEWNENSSTLVSKSGGYKIYIGLKQGEFIGSLPFTSNSKQLHRTTSTSYPMTVNEIKQKRLYPSLFHTRQKRKIRLVIDNKTIQDYLHRSGRGLPLLENNQVYYFAISSFNENGIESRVAPAKSFYIKPK